jgi:hypothetical protein
LFEFELLALIAAGRLPALVGARARSRFAWLVFLRRQSCLKNL